MKTIEGGVNMKEIRVAIRERKVVLSPVVLPTFSKLFILYPGDKRLAKEVDRRNQAFWNEFYRKFNIIKVFMEELPGGIPVDVIIVREKQNPNPFEFFVYYIFPAGLDDEEKFHNFRLKFREKVGEVVDNILMQELSEQELSPNKET